MKKILEICCDSIQSALYAEEGGADRIELCENLDQGGVTPSAGKIRLAKRLLNIPVFVLIRPRKADFLYSALEYELMLEEIRVAKSLGANGIVSGILHQDGSIDRSRTRHLVDAAFPLPFTFHRAFDMCFDPADALQQLKELGIKRVLTSGQKPTALEGTELIRKLVRLAGPDISIVAGGGITPGRVRELAQISGLREFHASARRPVRSRMQFMGKISMSLADPQEEFHWMQTDREVVSELRRMLGH